MFSLTEIFPDIHRLTIPFEDIYTTVFIIRTPQGDVLLDTATYAGDIDNYLLPSLIKLGISEDTLKYIVISHSHRDHAGGLERLMEFFPNACIVSGSAALRERFTRFSTVSPEKCPLLLSVLELILIPGHAPDCLGLLDLRSRTLLTGDSLQLYGIYGSGQWGANISKPSEHLHAIEKLRTLDVSAIVASHDYHPCGHIARSADEISTYLDQCVEALYQIRDSILASPMTDDQTLSDQYNRTSGLPTVGSHVFKAVRAALIP